MLQTNSESVNAPWSMLRCENVDYLQQQLFRACCYRFEHFTGGKPCLRSRDVRIHIESLPFNIPDKLSLSIKTDDKDNNSLIPTTATRTKIITTTTKTGSPLAEFSPPLLSHYNSCSRSTVPLSPSLKSDLGSNNYLKQKALEEINIEMKFKKLENKNGLAKNDSCPKRRRALEMKIWDSFMEDLFRMDCVGPLVRGTYGHPYLMCRTPNIEEVVRSLKPVKKSGDRHNNNHNNENKTQKNNESLHIEAKNRYVVKFVFYDDKHSEQKQQRQQKQQKQNSHGLKQQKILPILHKQDPITILPEQSNNKIEDDTERPENADVIINTLLSADVRNGALPFVTLPIMSFVCSEGRVRDVMLRYDPELKKQREKLATARIQLWKATRSSPSYSSPFHFSSNSNSNSNSKSLSIQTQQQKQQLQQELQQEEDQEKKEDKYSKMLKDAEMQYNILQKQYRIAEREWLENFWQHLGRKRVRQSSNLNGGVLVYIAEYASLGSLSNYTMAHQCDIEVWRSILAQCFYALAFFQARWPQFRHNDLHPGNILLESVPQSTYAFALTRQHDLIIDNHAIEVRLWDFDYACIAGIQNNRKAESAAKFGISSQPHAYYDLHTLCNTLITEFELPPLIYSFLKELVPEQLRYARRRFCRLDINDRHIFTSPLAVLAHHPFFTCYRRPRSTSK